ncbi:protein FLX-like 1 isoform X1 [Cicer arietinum]|uniref:Protein FLX-like 1 n=2 Tax=Cicer arietinum TaxID=3827 RepID=A0A1S2XFA6_CICAR|nr:protein FLX-like 1 [Cicer arietinum]
MSNRNRGQPHPPHLPHAAISPPIHDPIFAMRGGGGGHPPHPSLLEDFRESQLGLGHRPHHLHPAAVIEERLAVQHGEIQGLLGDNQRLAATHVALKQELEAAQHELQRMAHFKDSLRADTEGRMRELYEKAAQLEAELRGADAARAELQQLHGDIKELTAVRQDLSGQVQAMSQDLARMTADLKRMPALRADVDGMKQELQCARAAIEYEKKGFTENYEHGQVMEKKLIAMAREMEKLRAEIANAEKRARAAAAAGNTGPGYHANYGNAETGYAGNPYPAAYYGMNQNQNQNQVQPGVENFPQYGPGPAAWGAYDMQRAQGQGHR